MSDSLRLIAATEDMRDLLAGVLAEHGIAHQVHGKMVVIEGAPEPVVGLLRSVLSGPEREAVSVVEELNFPHEFPVTTRLEAWWSVFETSWFEKAVATDAFSVWFQPVVDTTARQIIGHECLLRLTKGHRREGAEILAAASARHNLRAFDAYTRQLAIRAISTQPASGAMCFLNFIPSTIYRPSYCMREMIELLRETNLRPGNIVMEAVGSNRNPDIVHLRRIGDYLREEGLGFALDDVGDNAEAMRLVCDLRPDYIKLDRHLVNRMDQARHAYAVRKLVEVAERLSVRVIAKGVERVSNMELLWAAGVQRMQGYLFGSPTPEMSGTAMDLAHLTRAMTNPVSPGASACLPEPAILSPYRESIIPSHAGR
jgi:EAL domain-containing protein (putative c-di-GMP-specific phosphodiesterase class I)